jgi:hypothetical protein
LDQVADLCGFTFEMICLGWPLFFTTTTKKLAQDQKYTFLSRVHSHWWS